MSDYIGAIDQGTTSMRFIVFDRSGRIVSVAQNAHEQIFPQPGWVEHDAADIWRRTQEVIAEALKQRGLRASDLAAIGITNQRETTVVWDRKTGHPVNNALVWQDTRVGQYVAPLPRDGGPIAFAPKPAYPWPLISAGSRFAGFWITSLVFEERAEAEGRFVQ